MKELSFHTLYKITVVLVFSTLFIFILIVGKGVLVPLTVAFFTAFLLIPLNNLLERIRFPRPLAAITSVLVFIIGLSGALALLASQVKRFTDDMDQISEKIGELKSRLPDSILSYVQGYSSENIIGMAQSHMGAIFTSVSGFFGSFTVIILIPIYIALVLIYRDHIKEFLFRLFRQKSENDSKEIKINPRGGIKELVPKIRKVIQKYLTGVFYVMCILFVLNSIALVSLGIEHAFLFAAIAAFLNIIPFIGPFIGSLLPMTFALLTKDSLFYPIAILCCFVVIQALEGNFLTPKIVGTNVSLNPLITLITLIVGASVWGLVGMILFIPLVAILREIFQSVDKLEPYAYLLGNPDDGPKRANFATYLYHRIKRKLQSSSNS